jgi:hypothetical protein
MTGGTFDPRRPDAAAPTCIIDSQSVRSAEFIGGLGSTAAWPHGPAVVVDVLIDHNPGRLPCRQLRLALVP